MVNTLFVVGAEVVAVAVEQRSAGAGRVKRFIFCTSAGYALTQTDGVHSSKITSHSGSAKPYNSPVAYQTSSIMHNDF
jgi:hypothetical protein